MVARIGATPRTRISGAATGSYTFPVHCLAAVAVMQGGVRQLNPLGTAELLRPVVAVPFALRGAFIRRRATGWVGVAPACSTGARRLPAARRTGIGPVTEEVAAALRARPEQHLPQPPDRGPLPLECAGDRGQRVDGRTERLALCAAQRSGSGPLDDGAQIGERDLPRLYPSSSRYRAVSGYP
jgi:hypothetical protein